jgi:ElaB/YqjD/DUF883 family membrane-anchored ribosome-binding protein
MSSARIERSDIERLLREFEARLTRVMGTASRMSASAPRKAEGFADTIVASLGDMADRIGGRARNVDVAQMSDDALRLGNQALRKLTHEVERKPLVTLAIAAGIGAIAFGLLMKRD